MLPPSPARLAALAAIAREEKNSPFNSNVIKKAVPVDASLINWGQKRGLNEDYNSTEDKDESPLKRAKFGHAHLHDETENSAKRVKLNVRDEDEGIVLSLSQRFASFEERALTGGKSPQLRPTPSSPIVSKQMQPLSSPSLSRTVSDSSQVSSSTTGNESSSQRVELLEGVEKGLESGEFNFSFTTVLTQPDHGHGLLVITLPAIPTSINQTPTPPTISVKEKLEKLAKFSHGLRLRLTYAAYKILTNQTDIPFEELQALPVPASSFTKILDPRRVLDMDIARWEKAYEVSKEQTRALSASFEGQEGVKAYLRDVATLRKKKRWEGAMKDGEIVIDPRLVDERLLSPSAVDSQVLLSSPAPGPVTPKTPTHTFNQPILYGWSPTTFEEPKTPKRPRTFKSPKTPNRQTSFEYPELGPESPHSKLKALGFETDSSDEEDEVEDWEDEYEEYENIAYGTANCGGFE